MNMLRTAPSLLPSGLAAVTNIVVMDPARGSDSLAHLHRDED